MCMFGLACGEQTLTHSAIQVNLISLLLPFIWHFKMLSMLRTHFTSRPATTVCANYIENLFLIQRDIRLEDQYLLECVKVFF